MATDYAYDINVSDDKKHITLAVELPERALARDPILEMNDSNAIDIIRDNGFGTYVLVRTGGRLSNWVSQEGIGGNRSGEWIFERPVAKKTVAKKTVTKKVVTATETNTKTKTTKTNS
jgi:hypothetical protein